MSNLNPDQINEITTLLDGIDFENGEITVAKRKIQENLQEIRKILSVTKEEF